jgi:hypothetical protein
LEADQT